MQPKSLPTDHRTTRILGSGSKAQGVHLKGGYRFIIWVVVKSMVPVLVSRILNYIYIYIHTIILMFMWPRIPYTIYYIP